ncbi:DUF4342 domain-containing protein [Eubacteriales bacterium KG127]
MEITLEKIELVKDRTGVSYREAKDALEKSGGNVVDAIISIEDSVNKQSQSKKEAKKEDLIEKLKNIVAKGNATKILVKKGDDVVLNLPVNAGIIGTVVAPWGMVAGLVAAFGFKYKIEVVKDDGSTIDISEKADDLYDKGASYCGKAGQIIDDAKEKGSEYFDELREKTPAVADMYDGLKDFAADIKDKILDRKSDLEVEWEELKDDADNLAKEAKADAKDLVSDTKGKAKEVADDAKDLTKEVVEETKETANNLSKEAESKKVEALDALNEKLNAIEKELDK